MNVNRDKRIFTLLSGAILALVALATAELIIRNIGILIGFIGIDSSLPLPQILSQLNTAQIQLPILTVLVTSIVLSWLISFAKKHIRVFLLILLYLPLTGFSLCFATVNSIRFIDAVRTILQILGSGV